MNIKLAKRPSKENDNATGLLTEVQQTTADQTINAPVAPTHQSTDIQIGAFEQLFREVADDKKEIGWQELKQILDQSLRDEIGYTKPNGSAKTSDANDEPESSRGLFAMLCGGFCQKDASNVLDADAANNNFTAITLGDNEGFSKDICRSMVAMLDADHSGKLGIDEFKKLMVDIAKWRTVFKSFDHDGSGKFNTFELRAALEASGYKLSNHVLNALVHRYGSRDGQIAFDDFIMCAVKIKTMIDLFEERDVEKTNSATFNLDEWMAKTLYT